MPPDRPRQLWLLPVLLITVIATAVGGLLARTWYEDAGPIEPAAVIPSPSSVPPGEQPGSRVVEGTPDAIAHPLYRTVRGLLQRYFDAINNRDYAAWQRTVISERVERQPEEKWLADYRSTQDGHIVIFRIELGEDDTARVLMTFTSVQDPVDAPQELPVGCINWNVVFPLVLEDDGWKLDSSPASASPSTSSAPPPDRARGRAGGQAAVGRGQAAVKARATLCPPKPNESFTAAVSSSLRGSPATTSSATFGSWFSRLRVAGMMPW